MSSMNVTCVDWKKILSETRQWCHFKRRRYIKKLKRSAKRRLCASSSGQTLLEITENESQSSYGFGSVYDCVVRETVLLLLNNLITLVHENENAVCNGFISLASSNPHQNLAINHQKSDSNEIENPSAASADVVSNKDKVAETSNKTAATENDDLIKTIETERFLEELDEEVKKWHNPFLPESTEEPSNESMATELPQSQQYITEIAASNQTTSAPKPKQVCNFYEKVGSCRFGDNCSREHRKVDSSKILLLSGMFSTFAFDIVERAQKTSQGDIDDMWMEYSDADLYDEFVEFYNDVIPELETYGKLNQFKVCCNRDKHLLGNVYVQYKHEKDAVHAFSKLNGRFYGGKALSVKYILIKSWKSAICGLHYHNRSCPRGYHCNFLHVFKEPSRRFYDMDISDSAEFRHKRRNSSYSERSRHRRSEYREKQSKRATSTVNDYSPELKRHKTSKHKKSSHKHIRKHKKKKARGGDISE